MRLKWIALFSTLIVLPSHAQASLLDKAVNVITDPLKLDASTQNIIEAVERARILSKEWQTYLDTSGAKIDQSVQNYFKSVDGIVGKAFAEARLTLDDASARLNELEQNTFKDANRFVLCSAAVSSQEIQELLASSLNKIGASRPRFVIFGIEIGSVQFTPQDIDNPVVFYDKIKTNTLKRVNGFGPEMEAKYVQFAYGDLERVAMRTACFYHDDNPLSARFKRDVLDFRRLGQPWDGLVQ